MPIDMAPPQLPLQGYNIPAPQYTDPLETLARMQQMKTQAIQQQQANLGLQQAQLKLDSNKAMMDAFVKGGGDIDKTMNFMSQSGKVLPEDMITLQNHLQDYKTKAATLRKDQQQILKDDTNQYAAFLNGATDQESLNAANAKAQQVGIGDNVPRLTVWPGDVDHVKAFANSLLGQSQLLDQQLKGEQIKREQAGTASELAKTQETQQNVAKGDVEAAVRDIQLSAKDPATGTPTPDSWARIRALHPNLNLEPVPTKEGIANLTGAAVPVKDQADYQLKQLRLRLGMFGDSPEEQYLARYAQTLGKKSLADLTFSEYRAGMQKYAEDKQDPQMRQIAMQQKNLQEQLTQAQVASLPNPKAIDLYANMLLSHDMSPDQFAELRSGRVAWAPQVFQRAAQIAQSQGKAFSPATLEADYGAMRDTEKTFATGPEAQMARSFSNLMEHVGLIDQARKALGTGNIPLLRAIGNSIGVQAGGTAQTSYDTIADYVANEAAKAFLPSGGGESERARNAAHFDRSLGNDQLQKNIKELLDLADAQRRGLEYQYQKGTYGKGSQQLFTPQALAVRERFLGPLPAKTAPGTAPPAAGGTPEIPATIPQQYRSTAHYSPSQKAWYYSTDGGKTFLKLQQ
jgi:hypothetical protein